jgi:hypothetical protein
MDDRKQGGMTGATGNLTSDEPDEAFVPAETREISDPAAARQLTESAHRRAEARQAERPDDPGRPRETEAEESAPADPSPMLGGDERHALEDEHF